MPSQCRYFVTLGSLTILFCTGALARAERPIPNGPATVMLGYETTSGPVSFSGLRNFEPDAEGPGDATILGAAPNVRMFNSINSFGRRTALANSNPIFADVLGPDETLIAHAFFKNVPFDVDEDFFPDIVEGADVSISIGPITFDHPVTVVDSTVLFHTLWNEQADELEHPYHHLHNLHTAADPFRDFDDFVAGGIFATFPENNFTLASITPTFTGNGTDTLMLNIDIPYDMLKNLEEKGHGKVPPGLPAPHGFLEPFHFHVEYVVTPEPATLAMLLPACWWLNRRRQPGRSSRP